MAANPPGACCTSGHIHTGTPKGILKLLEGVECYITSPSTPNNTTILFLTDVYGHKHSNAQLLADEFAHNGYTVVMPDLFAGDPRRKDMDISLDTWLQSHTPSHILPIVDTVLTALREEFKPTKVGAVGYCLGAKYVTILLDGKIDAGFNAHPSLVTFEELAAIKAPLSIAAAETDRIFTQELRYKSEDKLREVGATYEITLYSGIVHGFALRGNMEDKWEKWTKEKAFKQAAEWFKLHLA